MERFTRGHKKKDQNKKRKDNNVMMTTAQTERTAVLVFVSDPCFRVREQVVLIIHAVGHTVEVLCLSQQLPLQRRAGPNVHKGGLQVVFAEEGVCVSPDGGRRIK
ncbi:hypothetical protein INR49_021299 [Caranx melampygus]|nr:hypothetical protein INR49_021299 [Caranx melampygus]